MIDKLFSRTSNQINDLERELDKLLSTDTKDTTEKMKWPLYQRIETVIDLIYQGCNAQGFCYPPIKKQIVLNKSKKYISLEK